MAGQIPASLASEMETALADQFAGDNNGAVQNGAPAAPAQSGQQADTPDNNPAAPAKEDDVVVVSGEPNTENEPVNTQTNESPKFSDEDVLKYLKEKSGYEFSDFDEINSALKSNKELQKAQKKIAELEGLVPTDANSKKLLEFLREGGNAETFVELQKLDMAKMPDKDKMVQYHIKKNGLTYDEAENLVDETYRLGEDEDDTDRTVKAARTRLKVDAKQEADPYLTKWKQDAVSQKEQVKANPNVELWEGKTEKVMEDISKSTDFSFDNKTYRYNLTKEQKDGLAASFQEAINNIPDTIDPNSKEGQAYAKELAESLLWIKHGKSILNSVVASYKAQSIKEKANSTIGLPVQTPGGNGSIDPEEQLLMDVKRRYGKS